MADKANAPTAVVPEIVNSRKGSASALLLAATELRDKSKCQGCLGKGTVSRRTTNGTTTGDGYGPTAYREVTEKCRSCNGSLLNKPEKLSAYLERVVVALNSLNAADPKAKHARSFAKDLLEQFAASRGSADALNPAAITAVTGTDPKRGRCVAFVGTLRADIELDGRMDRLIMVDVLGTETAIAITLPEIVDGGAGDTVLVGGQLRGVVGTESGPVGVLQGGFVLKR
ncbi:MAG: hypothetical protein IT438_06760 [Phycisphaerales bacterium]|nr:hypothetical protein [Phycisphaerales bacterium]